MCLSRIIKKYKYNNDNKDTFKTTTIKCPVYGGVVTERLKVGGASEEKKEVVKNTSRGWKQTTDSE